MPTTVDSSVERFQTCIDACTSCMQACEQCLTSCLQEPDVKNRFKCIQTLRDCADICALASQWMSRDSSYARELCGLCAEICDACAKECDMFQDAHCKACADACRQCAQECRTMANM